MGILNKIRKQDADDHINTDRYLITYADLITLLLGLFVILYVTAQVDEGKYKEFSKAFSDYFKSSKEQVLQGGGGLMEGHKKSIPVPVFQNPARQSLQDIKTEIEKSLEPLIKQNLFSIKNGPDGLILTLPEKLIFKSGEADIEAKAQPVLDSIASLMSGLNKQITVDGHTDTQPIKTFRFESNWHLSTARALKIGYALIRKGIPEKNVVIRGFGAQRPISDNSTLEGRTLNRRVEITISELPNNALSTNGLKIINK